MNKRLVEKMIPIAINKIESRAVDILKNGNEISKAFNGYIASFATSIVQAGIRQSVLFYSDVGAKTREKRYKITELIFVVLQDVGLIDGSYNSLADYVIDTNIDITKAKGDILDAALACKMAIRSFKLVEDYE